MIFDILLIAFWILFYADGIANGPVTRRLSDVGLRLSVAMEIQQRDMLRRAGLEDFL